MKKYIIYKKKTKRVEMISDGKIKYDKSIFAEKEMTLTPTEYKEILSSEETFLIRGKLKLKPRIEKKEKVKDIEDRLENANGLEQVKEIVKEIINL